MFQCAIIIKSTDEVFYTYGTSQLGLNSLMGRVATAFDSTDLDHFHHYENFFWGVASEDRYNNHPHV